MVQLAEEMIAAVESVDLDRIEGARDRVNKDLLPLLLPRFADLEDDYQRAAFAMLICDQLDPSTHAVMRKVLELPDNEDIFNIARAAALDHLAGRFGASPDWKDLPRLNEAVSKELKKI